MCTYFHSECCTKYFILPDVVGRVASTLQRDEESSNMPSTSIIFIIIIFGLLSLSC
jgi:hypothetical protein